MGALFILAGLLFCFGFIYPVCGIICYKLAGSKKSILEIISEL